MKIFPLFLVLTWIVFVMVGLFWIHGRTVSPIPESLVLNRYAMEAAESVLLSSGRKPDPRELRAFGQCTDLCAAILSNPEAPPLIVILRPNPKPEAVSWAEIESVVRSGNIVQGDAPHSGHISVTTRDGRWLTSMAPHVDALAELCREIDPAGVFVRVAIE